ncbi:hypothetical protein pb186bvf_016069 [Paramecium bursaria]
MSKSESTSDFNTKHPRAVDFIINIFIYIIHRNKLLTQQQQIQIDIIIGCYCDSFSNKISEKIQAEQNYRQIEKQSEVKKFKIKTQNDRYLQNKI